MDKKSKLHKPRRTRYVNAGIARAAWHKAQGRCTYVAIDGTRCESTYALELDHVEPFARGGEASAANMRLLCRTHNIQTAREAFGRDFMARFEN